MKNLADRLIKDAERLTSASNSTTILHIVYDAHHNTTNAVCVKKAFSLDDFDFVLKIQIALLTVKRCPLNGRVKRFFLTRGIDI
jgi:hypothetical protein